MRILWVLLPLFLGTGPIVRGADSAPAKPPDFAALEAAWNDGHRGGDADALEALWAEDITIIVPRMPQFSRAEALQMWRSVPVKFSAYNSSVATTRVHGDSAVVTGALHRERDFGGRFASEDWLFTKLYVLDSGRWRVAAFHASEAPPQGE